MRSFLQFEGIFDKDPNCENLFKSDMAMGTEGPLQRACQKNKASILSCRFEQSEIRSPRLVLAVSALFATTASRSSEEEVSS